MNVKRKIGIVVSVLGLSLIGLLFYYLMWFITDDEIRQDILKGWPLSSWGMLIDYVACCLFTTVVTVYYWRNRLKTEKERDLLRMQVMENQLSPHFVLNNFSILASLIKVDTNKAYDFLLSLSKVYRYVLNHIDHDTVSIKDELEFLCHYKNLLNKRFGDSIILNISDKLYDCEGELPPASLQLLIENAIKHNEHTHTHPLAIDVECDGSLISVSNQKRSISTSLEGSVGHHNIIERYRLLTNEKVLINETNNKYCVTIPIIKK